MSEQKYFKAVSVDAAVKTIRSNFELWRNNKINDALLDFHVDSNLKILESLKPIEPPEPLTDGELIEKCKEVLLRYCVDLKATNQNVSGKWLNENAIHALNNLLKQAGYKSAQYYNQTFGKEGKV